MTARLASHLLVSALVRRVNAAGGAGMILAKGDLTAGAVLLLCADRGELKFLMERVIGPDGHTGWQRTGPVPLESAAVNAFVEKRRRIDPDLWLVELDIPGVERFAADLAAEG